VYWSGNDLNENKIDKKVEETDCITEFVKHMSANVCRQTLEHAMCQTQW